MRVDDEKARLFVRSGVVPAEGLKSNLELQPLLLAEQKLDWLACSLLQLFSPVHADLKCK
jgi:hypothetical protein